MTQVSPLAPIDPSTITSEDQNAAEAEKKAPWLVRKLVGSVTGRVVMSSLESLKAAGTSISCLSALNGIQWGDSSPLFLPCIRFRDLVVHAVIAGTGGIAAVASPAMGPVADATIETFGDTLLVEMGLSAGFEAATFVGNDILISHVIKHAIPAPSKRLETTGIKELTITIKYKHTIEDAQLGFFRSSVHNDGDAEAGLFSNVKDYLAIEKGWFSPYLFASGRRPIIPRSMKPDVIFCHGPFLGGDYMIGTRLLNESASILLLCEAPPSPLEEPALISTSGSAGNTDSKHSHHFSSLYIPKLSKYLSQTRSRSPSPEPALAPVIVPPRPRRMVILLLAIAPHRAGMWTSSARPGESAIKYTLLNGCPAIVIPARLGAPLVAWMGNTLEQLQELRDDLPPPEEDSDCASVKSGQTSGKMRGGPRFVAAVNALFEYVDLCIDWSRVTLESEGTGNVSDGGAQNDALAGDDQRKDAVRDALSMLLIAAICSKDSKEVKKSVDAERAGLVFFRVP